MLAVTFEADIVSEYLRIPNFEQLRNKHVRVVIEAEEVAATQASTMQVIKSLLNNARTKPFQQINDPMAWQKAQRDEWA
jgi:hypothetical protein